jgi:hypothetical protein
MMSLASPSPSHRNVDRTRASSSFFQQGRFHMPVKIIANIRSGSLTEKGLTNLYNNVRDKNLPGVIVAIEEQMRGQFPRSASRLFGKKEAAAV